MSWQLHDLGFCNVEINNKSKPPTISLSKIALDKLVPQEKIKYALLSLTIKNIG